MSDDLVKRLRANGLDECDEAIARIEELEAKLAKLEAAAQKAVGHITGYGEASTARIELRTTLAELSSVSCANTTGGKDE